MNGAPPEILDTFRLRLWNPITGTCTSVLDSTGEMRSVREKGREEER
jgi:hypothetical protein